MSNGVFDRAESKAGIGTFIRIVGEGAERAISVAIAAFIRTLSSLGISVAVIPAEPNGFCSWPGYKASNQAKTLI